MKKITYRLYYMVLLCFVSFSLMAKEEVMLSDLRNDELMLQGHAIYDQYAKPFLASLRSIKNNEQRLGLIQKKIDAQGSSAEGEVKPSQDQDKKSIKASLDYIKKQQGIMLSLRERVLEKQSLLSAQVDQVESATLATDLFISNFDRFNLYVLEIQLRLEDGTLDKKDIPELFQPETIQEKRTDSKQQSQRLTEILITARQQLAIFSETLTPLTVKIEKLNAQKLVLEKEQLHFLENQKAREHYIDRPFGKLQQEFYGLYSESHWLERHTNQLYRYFKGKEKRLDEEELGLKEYEEEQDKQLKNAGVSDINELQRLDTNNIDEAGKLSNLVIKINNDKLTLFRRIQSKLSFLINTGSKLTNEMYIFKSHLAKMAVLSDIFEELSLKNREVSDWFDKNNHTQDIKKLTRTIEKRLIYILAVIKRSEARALVINDYIDTAIRVKQEVNQKVSNLKKLFESNDEVSHWVATIKEIDTKALLDHFNKEKVALELKEKQLTQQASEFELSKEIKNTAEKSLNSIHDPLWQLVQQQSYATQLESMSRLYQFSDLDIPDKYRQKEEVIDNKKVTSEVQASEKGMAISEIKESQYQDYLSSWLRVISERKKSKGILLTKLEDLQKSITTYAKMIVTTRNTATKYKADAAEIKNRFIHNYEKMKDIGDYGLTKNINAALNMTLMTDIDKQADYLLHQQEMVRKLMEGTLLSNEKQQGIEALLTTVTQLSAQRIETQEALNKLTQDMLLKRGEMNPLELQSLEQTALRNLNKNNNVKEVLLGYAPSKTALHLTSLIQNSYMELIELNRKDKNISQQIQYVNQIILLAQKEKPLLESFVASLVELISEIEIKRDEVKAGLEMSLVPSKANDISEQFFTKTGNKLTIPSALEDDKKEEAIEVVGQYISDYSITLLALQKWVALFNDRLASSGLDHYIGENQNTLGRLSADKTSLLHRIYTISGYPDEHQNTLSKEELPKTDREKIRMTQGEIGMLRDDRYQVYQDAIIQLVIKLSSILLVAMLLLKTVNAIFSLLKRRVADKLDPQLSFVQAFFNTIINIAIWSVTILTLLSSLGFQVGAILAGLGIGGFAIAIAAKETLSNILSGITLFIEKPFKIGDTIKIDMELPKKVVNMTWRSTQLIDSNFYYSNIPNSVVANATLINYTRSGISTRDYIDIFVPPHYDSYWVSDVMVDALDQVGDIIQQNEKKDVELKSVELYSNAPFIRYRVRFYLVDYHARGGIRNKILKQLNQSLLKNNIAIQVNFHDQSRLLMGD